MNHGDHARIAAHGQTLRAQIAALHELCAEVRRESRVAVAEAKIAIARSRAARMRREDRSQIP
jgi:hypothetical protein